MALENPMLEDKHHDSIIEIYPKSLMLESKGDDKDIWDDRFARQSSFKTLNTGVASSCSSEKKLEWLRSQLIGSDLKFETPYGTRRLTYADYTASGRSLRFIEDYIIENVLPCYGNTHTSDSFVGQQTTKMVQEASHYIKTCLGGKEGDALLFPGSGTTAAIKRLQEVMGLSIPSIMREKVLMNMSDEERWVVFVGPYEHHSNLLSWRQSLAEVVEIGPTEDGLIDTVELKAKLEFFRRTNRPMLGSFSACSNVTGIYTDTHGIASLLHQFGAFACFDFAASGPYEEIDMRSGEIDGFDAIFLSPHKFIGGPGTPGILLMSKALYRLGTSPPSTCGGGTVAFVNGFNEKDTLYYDELEEREDAGTPPIVQKVRTALVFWVKEYIGYEAIKAKEDYFVEKALERLLPNPNIHVLGNTRVKRQAIVSFLIFSTSNSSVLDSKSMDGRIHMWRESGNMTDKPLHGPFVAKLLNDLFGIQGRGGCACAGPYGHHLLNVDEPRSLAFRNAIEKGYNGVKPGWTRINFGYHISMEEFEFILSALEFIALYGQRFLSLYHFNWKDGSWTFRKASLISCLMQVASLNDNPTDRHKSHSVSGGLIEMYVSYFETAKKIADSLPKFPPPRKIPREIDLELVTFRI